MSTDKTPDFLASATTRRQLLTMAAVGGAGAAAVAAAGPSAAATAAAGPGTNGEVVRLTVLGTTDLHGNVLNWDYFKNAEFTDSRSNDIGVAKASSIIKAVKAEVGAERTLTIDAGDTIQGTPLAYYFARIDPITGGSTHPMAAAMNQVGYDAAALGNHEYNYGLDTLRAFEKQLNFPLLSANSVDWNTGAPVFKPWVIKTVKLPDTKAIKVGILGLVTPGVAIWDAANVEGKVRFPGIVEQAKVMVPRLKAAGADVVIVACHSGDNGASSWGDALPYVENASALLAQQVPGIDAILVGHAHLEIPQRYVTNTATGKQVLLSEPLYWGMRVTRMSIDVQKVRGQWQVVHTEATLYNSNVAPEDPSRHRRRRFGAREGADLRQQRHRHLEAGDVCRDLALRGHRRDGLHQLRAGPHREGGPRRHAAGRPSGPVDRCPVQQGRGDPRGQRHGARRRGSLHLRQHADRHRPHRPAGQGLPRAVGVVLPAAQRRRSVHAGAGDQRRDPAGTRRHARLQLRHRRRPRQGAHVRHRHRQGPSALASRTCRMPAPPSTCRPSSS